MGGAQGGRWGKGGSQSSSLDIFRYSLVTESYREKDGQIDSQKAHAVSHTHTRTQHILTHSLTHARTHARARTHTSERGIEKWGAGVRNERR